MNKTRTISRGQTRLKPLFSGWHPSGKISLSSGGQIKPAIRLDDKAEEYVIFLAVPGMERRDFTVNIGHGHLQVSAEKHRHTHELKMKAEPAWKDHFRLPEDADTLLTAAIYRNGGLEIHIPKGVDDGKARLHAVHVY